ncbi:MAG: lipid II flippase MurJ [Ramlibacter sp.]
MFLKAGVISLALLVASRVLGLLRESAQAAAFGASGAGDVAVLMLTLPDWLTGLVASGALAYVLLPHWAGQGPQAQAATQRRVAQVLIAGGLVLALAVGLAAQPLVGLLAPGLAAGLPAVAARGLWWSAAAVPAALLAALWVTRLQHERDFVGMYAANLVVNAVLVVGLLWVGHALPGPAIATGLGLALLGAMGLRLGWLGWRLRRRASAPGASGGTGAGNGAPHALPATALWVWAALSAGLPLALPFAARSLASQSGEGALALFNYAWKLVELPLVLAIQLTASLAFPVITRAFAAGGDPSAPVRRAFALAWTLACAAAAALLVGAPALAQLLFGWGRMDAQGLAAIGLWGQAGAWSLLPQALIAVALTVLATQGRMKAVAGAYAVALVLLLLAGRWAGGDGVRLMWLLDGVLAGVAVAAMGLLGRAARGWVPWRVMGLTAAALPLLALAALAVPVGSINIAGVLALSALSAIVIIAIGWWGSAGERTAVQR